MTTSQNSLMQYISKYKRGAELVTDLHKESSLLHNMPTLWADILFEQEAGRVRKTIYVWQTHFSYEYESLINIFKQYLKDVFLIKYQDKYSLVYAVGTPQKTLYYEGRNPLSKKVSDSVQPYWKLLPEGLRRFYDNLHDGWCYLASDSMGLIPAKDFMILDEQDWGILDEIKIDFDLRKVISVFSNSMGGYVCLNFNEEKFKGILWWNDNQPDVDIDFWPTVDEWTVIGIEKDLKIA